MVCLPELSICISCNLARKAERKASASIDRVMCRCQPCTDARFALIETGFALGRLKTRLDRPAQASNRGELVQLRRVRPEGHIKCDVCFDLRSNGGSTANGPMAAPAGETNEAAPPLAIPTGFACRNLGPASPNHKGVALSILRRPAGAARRLQQGVRQDLPRGACESPPSSASRCRERPGHGASCASPA